MKDVRFLYDIKITIFDMSFLYYLPFNTKKICFVIIFILLVIIVLFKNNNDLRTSNDDLRQTSQYIIQIRKDQARRTHLAIINKYMKERENWKTSVLGSWLFKLNRIVTPQKRSFLIHVHKEVNIRKDDLKGCSVNNCKFTKDENQLPIVDAVLVTLRRGYIPTRVHRSLHQRWIFMSDESPMNTYSSAQTRLNIEDLEDVFNWSLSYRTDSDIPFTYGRTIPLEEPILTNPHLLGLADIIPNWHRKTRDVLVAIMVSHCIYFRMKFIANLQKYIAVDVIGKCSTDLDIKNSCPGHSRKDCDRISIYLFYLAIENSDCREYLTEKIWHNAYMKGAVPIIMGPTLSDCERLLPPNSFIYVPNDYNMTTMEDLVKLLKKLSKDKNALLTLHEWRNNFNISLDYGVFGRKSALQCRICEGLNYNDRGIKIYTEEDLRWFLDPELLCGHYLL